MKNTFLTQVIEQSFKDKNPFLDLANCELTELPEVLTQMWWVEELNFNELFYFYQFKDYKGHKIDFNLEKNIRILRGISKLKSLKLGANNLRDISFLQNFKKLASLELSENSISDISPLKDLKQLESLDLSSNLMKDISPLKYLKQLEFLDLSSNLIKDISPLKYLEQLESLSLNYNHEISDISHLQYLEHLSTLKLSFINGLDDISSLKDLKKLRIVDLEYNQVKDFSPLKDLSELTELNLEMNTINDISFLRDLVKINKLWVGSNKIKDISPLKNLIQLESLIINGNRIKDISFLKDLKGMKHLVLSHNKIKDISVLSNLEQLGSLHLSDNKIIDYSVLSYLKQLKSISLTDNNIKDIFFLKDLQELEGLNLKNNEITDISFLQKFKQLRSLNLESNLLHYIPKEIYEQQNCIHDLKSYWQELESSQKTTNNQLKIMFLGNGCTGKTTLLHWFIDNEFKDIGLESRTHGIFIKPLKLCKGEVLGNFWDFGGQEVYHATHRLFLGRRTLYILVWATDTPEVENELRYPPQYWLDMIADIADKKERSRVLIVQNLFDNQVVNPYLLTKDALDNYTERGLDIDFISTNAKTGKNIPSFKLKVEEEVAHLLTIKPEILPETWVDIRTKVAKRRENKEKTLTFADFEQICVDCKLVGDPSVILGYLHRAGEVYYYENQFQNQIILDQEWALKAVYAVLKRKRIDRYKGIFELDDLIDIWRDANPDLTKEDAQIFLNFMLSNKIMFYTEGGNQRDNKSKFVIPQLLEDKTPLSYKTNKGKADNLIHRIEYAFLHRDIIERFIVNTAQFCKEKEYWRNGVFIEYNNAFAIVEAIKEEKIIHIECFGQEKEALLQKIREEFNKIRPLEKAKEYRIIKGDKIHFNDKMPIQNDDKKSGLSDEALDKALSAKIENIINTALEKITLFNNDNPSKSMKKHLLNLISDGKLKEALDLMRQIEDTQSSYFQNPLIGFLSRFNRNENDKNGGTLSQTDYNIERNRIEAAVKSLLDSEFDDSKAPTPPKNEPKQDKPVKNNQKSVFISYNHKDAESANKIKQYLENHGINVVIDTENLDAGEDIKAFIEKSVRENGATVSVVSPNSLMSAWVAMESVNTLYAQKVTDKKFIAACIDNSFFKRSFVDEALDKIEAEIKDIQETITKRLAKNRNITDLQNELSRYADLQHNLPTIVQKLKESLSVDISGDNLKKGWIK